MQGAAAQHLMLCCCGQYSYSCTLCTEPPVPLSPLPCLQTPHLLCLAYILLRRCAPAAPRHRHEVCHRRRRGALHGALHCSHVCHSAAGARGSAPSPWLRHDERRQRRQRGRRGPVAPAGGRGSCSRRRLGWLLQPSTLCVVFTLPGSPGKAASRISFLRNIN